MRQTSRQTEGNTDSQPSLVKVHQDRFHHILQSNTEVKKNRSSVLPLRRCETCKISRFEKKRTVQGFPGQRFFEAFLANPSATDDIRCYLPRCHELVREFGIKVPHVVHMHHLINVLCRNRLHCWVALYRDTTDPDPSASQAVAPPGIPRPKVNEEHRA